MANPPPITRRAGETWRDAALRLARIDNVEHEVDASYRHGKECGLSDEKAALEACLHWELSELQEDR